MHSLVTPLLTLFTGRPARRAAWLVPVWFCLALASGNAGSAENPAVEDEIQEVAPEITPALPPPLRANFAGAWEKDFGRSDKWDDELERLLDQMRRDAQRAQSGGPAVSYSGSQARGRRSGASVIDLAQLAEYISRQTTIRIRQSAVEVRIQREGDADLVCSTLQDTMASFTSEYGNEICGWDARQLVFSITLPQGVNILHRFTVSEDREELNLATSIASGGAPFNLLQYYRRYDAPNENYNCIETISRGNSCSLTDFQLGN